MRRNPIDPILARIPPWSRPLCMYVCHFPRGARPLAQTLSRSRERVPPLRMLGGYRTHPHGGRFAQFCTVRRDGRSDLVWKLVRECLCVSVGRMSRKVTWQITSAWKPARDSLSDRSGSHAYEVTWRVGSGGNGVRGGDRVGVRGLHSSPEGSGLLGVGRGSHLRAGWSPPVEDRVPWGITVTGRRHLPGHSEKPRIGKDRRVGDHEHTHTATMGRLRRRHVPRGTVLRHFAFAKI